MPLKSKFEIELDSKMEGALNNMGRDLLDGILESYYDEGVEEGHEKGLKEGIDKGMDQGNIERLLAYIKKKKVSIETALDDLDIPIVKRDQYADYLKSNLF